MDNLSACNTNIMIFNGKGLVRVLPDTAVLQLGVQTTGMNLTTSQSENARLSQAVLQTLAQLNITDIKTHQYEITKLYDYDNGRQIDQGYSVRNILEIRTDQLELVSQILDRVVAQGANIVNFIRFEVSDPEPYYLTALNYAVTASYEKANSIAESFGLQLCPYPKRIIENSSFISPYQTVEMRQGSFSTPIEPGTNQIEATVTVEFTY
jgi:uncharacterized protein YggE